MHNSNNAKYKKCKGPNTKKNNKKEYLVICHIFRLFLTRLHIGIIRQNSTNFGGQILNDSWVSNENVCFLKKHLVEKW